MSDKVFKRKLTVTKIKAAVARTFKPFAPSAIVGYSTPYVAADNRNETMIDWNPQIRSADHETSQARSQITARSRDLVRNNGWAAGGVSKEVDAVIGSTFRPLSKPDHHALGLTVEWATDFKRRVESLWRRDSEDPRNFMDLTRDQTFGMMAGMAYRNYVMEGDALGIIFWRADRKCKTCMRVIDPDLLSNPMDAQDDEYLRSGVELDSDQVAIRYHFRRDHVSQSFSTVDAYQWDSVDREQDWGRPIVLHHFDKHRDGQTRGISRLAPIIEKLRMEDRYGRVELQAAVINAVLAAFIKSPMDPEAITDMLSEGDDGWSKYTADRKEYYDDRGEVSFAGAKLTHLYPGEDIGTVSAARPSAQFADFESAVLRHVASGLGISYEQLSSDWSKTNYSSARAAMIEIWRGWTSRRQSFAQGFCQPYYMAWLEEKVQNGEVELPPGAPDFYENWASYARCKWIGPGKGFVDPVKEAQAAALRVSLGLSNLEDEAAELTGGDFTENIAQIAREIEMMPEGMLHPSQESFAKLMGTKGKATKPGKAKPQAARVAPTEDAPESTEETTE